MIDRLIDLFAVKILRVRPASYYFPQGPVEADPPPWDVPLDQTTAPVDYPRDKSSL